MLSIVSANLPAEMARDERRQANEIAQSTSGSRFILTCYYTAAAPKGAGEQVADGADKTELALRAAFFALFANEIQSRFSVLAVGGAFLDLHRHVFAVVGQSLHPMAFHRIALDLSVPIGH